MRHQTLKLISLVLLVGSQEQAYSFYSLTGIPRAHALWETHSNESNRSPLHNVYFVQGEPELENFHLSPTDKQRVLRFYRQCMSDGGMYCDNPNGSCEQGTCGKDNRKCKPYMNKREREIPLYGRQCVQYALSKVCGE